MSARRSWAISVVAHVAVALALRAVPWRTPPAPRVPPPAEPLTLFDVDPPPAPPPAVTEPTTPTTAPVAPAAAVRAPSHVAPQPAVAQPVAPQPVAPQPVAPQPVAPPVVNGRDILRGMHGDVMNLAVSQGMMNTAPAVTRPERDLFPGTRGDEASRVRDASAGYIGRELAATHQHDAPGVRDYYWSLRRRMIEEWRPGIQREPTLVDALVSGLMLPVSGVAAMQQSQAGGAVAPGALGSLNDSQNAHNNMQPMAGGIIDASRANLRTTHADIVVDQDAQGAVLAIRVVRSSHIASFDAEAVRAVRDALPLQDPVAMPGGRRSLWSFEVVASRDPIMPGVGIEFDESSGWFEVHVPGRLHLRSRVHLESSRPLGRS